MGFLGTTGDDTLTGTSGNDTFNVSQGGNDTVNALDGNDVINFGATLTAADKVNGGTGSDTVIIAGDYSAPLTFSATTLTAVEVLKLTAGNSYNFVMNDANAAGGQTLAINGALLGATDVLTFNGSAETNGFYRVEAGAADDAITMGAALRGKDTIDGGAGTDTLFVSGDYSLAFAAATLHNVENFVMAGGHDYHFVTNDTSIGAGDTMNVDATAVGTGHTVIFNGVREADGNFNFNAGAGEMELTGGAGTDAFFMGSHLTAADRIVGGAGNDTVFLGGANYSLVMQKPTLQGIEDLNLGAGFNYTLTLGGGIATNATMTVDASAAGTGNSFTLNAIKEIAGSVNVFLGAGAFSVVGGQQGDAFDASPSGQATFTASDRINGEDGYDRVYLDGDYTGAHALVFAGTTMVNVEELDLNAGHSYDVTIAANTIDDAGLKIDASQLGAANTLTFNASAAGAADTLFVIGGAGNDVLTGSGGTNSFDLSHGGDDKATGGAGDDTFVMGAALTAADTIDGVGFDNTITLDGDYNLTFSATTFTNIETLVLAGGHDYTLTTAPENIPLGTTLTVDASALGTGDTLVFDASAVHTPGGDTGMIDVIAGAGNDTLTAGADGGTFDLSEGGNDTATGGAAGANIFAMGAALNSGDRLNGVTSGLVRLNGDYTGANALTLNNTIIQNLGAVFAEGDHNYHITYTGALPIPVGQRTAFKFDATLLSANDTFFLDCSASTGLLTIDGGPGNDTIIGAAFDTIDISKGGNDTVNAAGGTVNAGAALTGADTLTNVGFLNLNGDYDAAHGTALNLTTADLTGGSQVTLGFNHNYDITVSSASVMSAISTTASSQGDLFVSLTFNGAAEASHGFSIFLNGNNGGGPVPTDTITTGGGADAITATGGLNLVLHANGGNDTMTLSAFTIGNSQIDGGAGNDTLTLPIGPDTILTSTTISSIETLILSGGASGKLTTADANVAAGQTMKVMASSDGTGFMNFDGSAETDGHFNIVCSAGTIIGGALNDTITASAADNISGGNYTGGGGGDTIDVHSASNQHITFHYGAVSDSTGVNYDTIKHLGFTNNSFAIASGDPTAIDTAVTAGSLSTASFDSDLAAAIGGGQLGAHHAVLFTANAGTLSGHTFLIVDENGTAGYQASADIVIDVTGASGALTTADFS